MPTADIYQNRVLDPTKKRPKVPGLATARFTPSSIFTGRPTEPINEVDNPVQGGLAGATTQFVPSPFSSLFLFKNRRK